MVTQMRSARLHDPGKPLRVDRVERPKPRRNDVLIEVRACGVIPNMNRLYAVESMPTGPGLPKGRRYTVTVVSFAPAP